MAGKFGSSAGEVIAEALVRARAEGTSRTGAEHLFAALLASPDSGPLLGRLGDPEQAEAVRAEVREARRRGGVRSQYFCPMIFARAGSLPARLRFLRDLVSGELAFLVLPGRNCSRRRGLSVLGVPVRPGL